MIQRLLRRVMYFLRRDRLERELAEEMAFHRSLSEPHAFGNAALALEDAREVWMLRWVDALGRDARYGLRMLRREPTFTFTAIATLAIGVLTVTTVFTVVDAQLWRPLPFPHPQQLIAVSATGPGGGNAYEDVSGPDFFAWRSGARLARYAAIGPSERRILHRDTSESVLSLIVSGNFFDVLASTPSAGRSFDERDEDGAHVAILSYRAWTDRFHADRGVVGRVMTLDRDTYTIVGVAPASGLQFITDPDVFLPLDRHAAEEAGWTSRTFDVLGRLAPGTTLAQADSELRALQARNAAAAPAAHEGHRVRLDALVNDSYYVVTNWRALWFFLAAAALVLLLACGNVAHLLVARALRRQHEFAIRGALGGGQPALVRQLAIEGALVAAPGVALGVLCSSWLLVVLSTRIPRAYMERGVPLTLDVRTAVFAAAIAVLATVALALAPLVFARRIDLNPMLGQSTRTAGFSPRRARVRHALVIGQITITLILLAVGGLFVVSFVKLTRMPLGFEPADRLAIRIDAVGDNRTDDAFVRAYANRVLEHARAVPGVATAAIGNSSPLGSGPTMTFAIAGTPRPAPGSESSGLFRAVSPDYFRTLGIRLLAGREFASGDGPGAPRVAIVNEHLAKRFFPDGRAIGHRLDFLKGYSRWTDRPGEVVIVGIAPHVKDVGMNEVEFDDIYVPFAQAPAPDFEVLIHTAVAPASVAAPLRRAVESIDASTVVGATATFGDRVERALAGDRFNMQLIVSFAAVAIVLAFVGIYGTMAYAMEERTREVGIRLALGASAREILREALWRSARLGLSGAALGACLAFIAGRLFGSALYLVPRVHEGLLYGVSATNPAVLLAAVALVVAIAVVAGLGPARRAMRVDPAVTLRE